MTNQTEQFKKVNERISELAEKTDKTKDDYAVFYELAKIVLELSKKISDESWYNMPFRKKKRLEVAKNAKELMVGIRSKEESIKILHKEYEFYS